MVVPALEHPTHRLWFNSYQLVVAPSPLVYISAWPRCYRMVGFVFSYCSRCLSPAESAAGFRSGSILILIDLILEHQASLFSQPF